MRRLTTVLAVLSMTTASAASAQLLSTGSTGVGTQDPNWQVSWVSGPYGNGGTSGSPYDAWVVPDIGGVWQPNGTGADWISAWESSSAPDGAGDYDEITGANARYIYTFTYTFTSAVAGNLLFNAAWDNIFQALIVNGVSYTPSSILTSATDADVDTHFGFCRTSDGILNSSDYPNCNASFSAGGITVGSNTVQFVLVGDGNSDGLWVDTPEVDGDVAPEPATWSLLGFGLVGLITATARRRSAQPALV